MSEQQRPGKMERYMAQNKKMVRPASANRSVRKRGGQALVEYALIIALVVIAILGIIALTGPAVGNVFSNAVWNLVNQTVTPYNTISPAQLVSYLTAVASYTPPPRGQAATGSPQPTATKTNTPIPVNTYTPTFTKTATATATATPTGPTVTPTDTQFQTNTSYDPNVLSQWHYDTYTNVSPEDGPSRARLLWNVDYYNNTSCATPAAATGDTLNDHIKFTWTGSPRTSVNADNFCVKYTAKNFADGVAFTANETWQIRVTGNQIMKVIIGGSTIINMDMGATDTIGTKVVYYTSPTTAHQTVVVQIADSTGTAAFDVSINRIADYGTCHWQTASNEYRSPYAAWGDSAETVAQPYRLNGSCSLRQRGWYDLTNTATMPNPRLIFWNRWKLNTGDSLQVGVRMYDVPSDHWTWTRVQKAIGTNFNWNRQIISLKSFPAAFDDATDVGTGLGAQPSTENIVNKDFTGHKVEIAFRVVSDGSNVEDGWYLDDIGVYNWSPTAQSFPYIDPIDNNTSTNWVNECKWSMFQDTSANRLVWTTNTYNNGADCPLMLDRQITVPTAAQDSNTPILQFDAKTRLDSGDQVRVEWALPTSDLMLNASWRALPKIGGVTPNACVPPPSAPTTDYSIYCSTVNIAWETLRVDLSTLRGQTVMLRFRLYADTSGDPPINATNPYGWSIDNVTIKTNSVNEVPMPFIEPFSTSSNWTLNGWSLSAGSDPARSAPTSLTDSANTTSYTSTTNITTLLNPAVRIVGSTNPIVSFYTRWQAPTANMELDFSTDDGFTWTPIWQFNRTTMGDENRAWERVEVRLVDALAAVGRTIATTPRIMFRFKMLATGSSTVGDGFYIDDFRVEELSVPTVTLNAGNNFILTEKLDSAPTVASTLTTPPQWNVGGDWTWQANAGHAGTGGWSDSVGGNYNNPLRSNLEYATQVNTASAQFPAFVFWTKYNMASGHTFAVDFKSNTGTWTQVWSNLDAAVSTPTNLGWHRVVVPIDNTLTQPIRARFRLNAMDSNTAADGIYLDDVQFVDRAVWTDFDTTLPSFTNAADQAKWIKEGDWAVPVTGVPVNATYGTLFGKPEVKVSTLSTVTAVSYDWGGTIGATTQWATQYWHNNSTTYWTGSPTGRAMNWTGLLATSPQVTQINPDLSLDVASDPTNLPIPPGVTAWNTGPAKNDSYAIRWRRYFNGSGGTYLLRLQLQGGAELWVNNVLQSPNATLPRPYVTSGTASNSAQSGARTYYYTITMGANTLIDVRFWHWTDALVGAAKIDFGIAEQRTVAKASPYATKYTHLTKTSLILDGYVTLPSGQTGVVSYDERWSLEQTDYATAYFSLDRGTTWTAVASTQHSPNSPDANGVSTQDWITTSYLIPNLSASSAKVMLKWELDARTNTAVADGWLIDNVNFAVSAGAANSAPTASTLAVNTFANVATSSTSPTVTDANMPLDYFKVAVTSAPKRGTAVVTTVANNTDTVRYTPLSDWTGVDNTMLYSVTDAGGLSIGGQQGVFTVNPKFDTGVDMGDVSGSTVGIVNGNTWNAQNNTSAVSATYNGIIGATTTISPSVDTATDAMLKDYVKALTTVTGLRVNFDIAPGMYSVYLYWVGSELTTQTFDVYLQGGADVVLDSYKGNRVENDLSVAAGQWKKTGPYTVEVTSNRDLTIRALDGGIAALAGIEWYQGGDYQNYTSADINPVSLGETTAGTTTVAAGVISMTAYGNDIWNNEDGLRYVYKAERGDIDLVVKIDSANLSSDGWAKAGIMFRDSMDANSKQLFFGITNQATTSADAIVTQYRNATAGGSTSVGENTGTRAVPIWLKVQKRGNVFDVFTSYDGVSYTATLGTYTVDVGTNYLYGVAITSHNNSAVASAQFSGVVVTLQ